MVNNISGEDKTLNTTVSNQKIARDSTVDNSFTTLKNTAVV